VVLLTKPDLCADVRGAAAVAAVAGGRPVHVLNPRSGEGARRIRGYVARAARARCWARRASARAPSSTAWWAGRRKTRAVREADSKGRHTTTHRELVPVPGGGLLLDTPGMRELQLWDVGDAVEQTFDDVERYAAGCRFGDCRIATSRGCGVKAAVARGAAGRAARAAIWRCRTSWRTWRGSRTSGADRREAPRAHRRQGAAAVTAAKGR
jgi:ribosome biogenesis GTPase